MTWIDVQHSACKELFVNVVATTNSLWFIALSHRGTDALPDFLKNTDCADLYARAKKHMYVGVSSSSEAIYELVFRTWFAVWKKMHEIK